MAIPAFLPIALGLAKVVPSIIGLFKGSDAEEKARKVVGIAQKLTGTEDPQAAIDKMVGDPELMVRFREAMLDFTLAMRQEENRQLDIVNATMRAELTSKDPYNARWRATFGYCVAFAWLAMFLTVGFAIGWAVVKQPDDAGTIYSGIGQLLSSTAMLWGVALSVLGVAVSKRSKDKETAAGMSSQGGPLGALIDKLKS